MATAERMLEYAQEEAGRCRRTASVWASMGMKAMAIEFTRRAQQADEAAKSWRAKVVEVQQKNARRAP